jgi:hypothetical protein
LYTFVMQYCILERNLLYHVWKMYPDNTMDCPAQAW